MITEELALKLFEDVRQEIYLKDEHATDCLNKLEAEFLLMQQALKSR